MFYLLKDLNDDISDRDEIAKWCKENIDGEVLVGEKAIFIKEDTDVVAFKLRWL